MIKKKILASILMLGVSVAYGLNNDFSALSSLPSQENIDQALSEGDSPTLSRSFVSSRTYTSFNDVKKVLQNQGLNVVVENQSSSTIPQNKISSSGTLKDYINKISNQFGYTWQFDAKSNTITFKAISPIVPATQKVANNNSSSASTSAQAQKAPVKVINVENSNNIYQAPIVIADKTSIVNTQNKSWTMTPQDRTVRLALERWSKEAGWQLVWRSKYDMPIEASLVIKGDFTYAINEICKASQATGKQMIAEMHNKNKVLVIYTPANNQ